MPNPVPAKYTVQLGPTVMPEVGGEIGAWAEVLGDSMSVIARECIDAGLAVMREKFAERANGAFQTVPDPATGETLHLPPVRILAAHVKAAKQRGERQVARRRAYDERTRSTDAPAAAKPTKRASKRAHNTAA